MTETTTQEQPVQFKDEMHKMQFDMLNSLIVKRNDLVGRYNAATGDRQTLTEQIRENSTDPAIVAAREAWSKAYNDLMALVDPQVNKVIADSTGSQDSIEAEIKDIDTKLKPGLTFYKKLYDSDGNEFATQERLKGTVVRSGGSGRRIRGFNVVVTIDGVSKEFENFASAAKHIDVDTQDLQSAFFSKAGTETLKDVPDVVNLVVNFDEVDDEGNKTEKEAVVKAYRTETAKAGSTEGSAEAESTDGSADDTDLDLENL